MAALTDPVNERNIISRFKDYTYAAWHGVTWGTNNLPVYAPGTGYAVTVIPSNEMRGPNTSDPGADSFIGKPDGTITGPDNEIIASRIYDYLNYFTYEYTFIRSVRALLTVTGAGGSQGTQPVGGNVYDVTAVAYFANRATQAGLVADYVYPVAGGVAVNQVIDDALLEAFMDRCRTSYNNFARNQTFLYNPIICHASCHVSCHGSRGRR